MEEIPNVDSAHFKTLQKALRACNIVPANTSLAIRDQARQFNSQLKASCPVEVSLPMRSNASANLATDPLLLAEAMPSHVSISSDSRPIDSPALPPLINNTVGSHRSNNINFSTWPVPTYSGYENTNEFFTRLEEIATSRNYDKTLLPPVLPEFLKNRALDYYRSHCSPSMHWHTLKEKFLERFEDADVDINRRLALWSSKQSNSERAADYISRIINLNNNISSDKLNNKDLLKVVGKGLHARFAPLIVSGKFTSLIELEKACISFEQLIGAVVEPETRPDKRPRPVTRSIATIKSERVFQPKCYRCNLPGHFSKDCRKRTQPPLRRSPRLKSSNKPLRLPDTTRPPPKFSKSPHRQVSCLSPLVPAEEWKDWLDSTQLFHETYHLNAAHISHGRDDRPFLHFRIHHISFRGLLDSGAAMNILGGSLYKSFVRIGYSLTPCKFSIHTVDNSPHNSLGTITLPLKFDSSVQSVSFVVVPTLNDCIILGVPFLKQSGLAPGLFPPDHRTILKPQPIVTFVSFVESRPPGIISAQELSSNQANELDNIKRSFEEISYETKGLGRTHLVKHHIDTGDHPPVKQRTFPQSHVRREQLITEIDHMLSLDVIDPCKSPWLNNNAVPHASFHNNIDHSSEPPSEELYAKSLENMKNTYQSVSDALLRAFRHNATRYNLRRKECNLTPGQVVWKRSFTLSDASKYVTAKLCPRFVKCRVKNRISRLIYELECMSGKSLGKFHVKDIVKF